MPRPDTHTRRVAYVCTPTRPAPRRDAVARCGHWSARRTQHVDRRRFACSRARRRPSRRCPSSKDSLRNGIRSFGSFRYVGNSFIFKEPSLFASKALKTAWISLDVLALQEIIKLLDVVALLLDLVRRRGFPRAFRFGRKGHRFPLALLELLFFCARPPCAWPPSPGPPPCTQSFPNWRGACATHIPALDALRIIFFGVDLGSCLLLLLLSFLPAAPRGFHLSALRGMLVYRTRGLRCLGCPACKPAPAPGAWLPLRVSRVLASRGRRLCGCLAPVPRSEAWHARPVWRALPRFAKLGLGAAGAPP